ncbi:uncharacterized protein LOC106162845 [Lingula anatina]|uniref:Uncharacterized protein LOC106162845 n=1 Tax=Lingula anatina TaxID=7574 RepID=A0A1S3IBU7_LINAN|nr:uncharacterized protein LOC106162845 [Lingula anatina]|eukprot:XP_013395730.1 uncharacterized protein LOC106162845 [Lingula anatina]
MATKEVQVEVDDIRAIFRTLAPYIVRYWKDVSRELGLTDEDILDIEHVHPMARLSELSYQCLCMWHEKQGRNATKDKLSHALRNLELKRAEDAISHLVVRRGRVSSPSRRNSVAGPSTGASRGRRRSTGQPPPPSVPRKKTGVRKRNNSETLHKPKQGGLRRTSSEKTIQSSQGEADSANTTPRKDNREIGEVHATIEVSNIEMRPQSVESMETDQDGTDDRNQTSETEQDTFQKMMLHYYTNVVKNAQDHINALTTLLEFKDIYVKRLRLGSIVVILVCKSLRALLHLLDMYNKGDLREACQKVFCTEKILREMGISDLSVKVTIPQREIVRCKEELLSGRLGPSESSPNGSPAPRRAFSAPNSVSKLLIPQELNHRSRGAYLASLKAFQKQTKEDVRTLSQRYRTFEKCIKEFMLTLQLIRSGDLGPVKNISQLEKCNDFLKTSQSIGKQVRTDLVQEFLTMLSFC